MRVEPYTVDSYIHALKRGARGMAITGSASDKWRFLRSLYYLNDAYFSDDWTKEVARHSLFYRPPDWPTRKPLVEILCYTLMPNHFHLLIREINEDGVANFMKKLGQSMTNHFNLKYKQKGSIFQGSYKGRTITDDNYFRYVAAYIMVKNVFELYPRGGLEGAMKDFNPAWEWGIKFPFSSLGDYAGERKDSPILEKGLLAEVWKSPKEFKSFSHEVIKGGKWKDVEFE